MKYQQRENLFVVHNKTWFIKVLHHQVSKVCKVRRHESLITEEKNLVCVTNTETEMLAAVLDLIDAMLMSEGDSN